MSTSTRKAAPRKKSVPATSRRRAASAPAAGDHILFTGYPGFIGGRLIPRLIELKPETTFHCLVQEKFLDAARMAVDKMAVDHPGTEGRMHLVVGDITHPGLGMPEAEAHRLQRLITGCFHLAAVYDLAVERELAMRINVEGTRNVLEFLSEAKSLRRFDYVSTAYVSGTAVGTFRETDLDVGQKFKNYYEETKFLAEVAVVERKLPTTIYRPGIVVGHSRTGETQKFDGPYFVLNAVRHLPSPGVFVKIGSGEAPSNIVPVDFVLEAIAQLASWDGSIGKTYHLSDPNPLSAFELEELFCKALGKTFVFVPVPLPVAKLIFAPPQVQKMFGMPAQTLDYFDHPVRYDTTQATADLAALGVTCPRVPDYVQALVSFYMKKASEIGGKAMI